MRGGKSFLHRKSPAGYTRVVVMVRQLVLHVVYTCTAMRCSVSVVWAIACIGGGHGHPHTMCTQCAIGHPNWTRKVYLSMIAGMTSVAEYYIHTEYILKS